jgi:hypothetical protein
LAKCSFEFPSAYSWPAVDKSVNDSISISSGLFSGTRNKPEVDSSLTIYIVKRSVSFPNYEALLEFDLGLRTKRPDDFRLLDRSTLTIGGVKGDKVVYNYSGIREDYQTKKQYLVPSISFGAFFENNDRLWKIEVYSIMEKSEKAKSAFDHLIESFKL